MKKQKNYIKLIYKNKNLNILLLAFVHLLNIPVKQGFVFFILNDFWYFL